MEMFLHSLKMLFLYFTEFDGKIWLKWFHFFVLNFLKTMVQKSDYIKLLCHKLTDLD